MSKALKNYFYFIVTDLIEKTDISLFPKDRCVRYPFYYYEEGECSSLMDDTYSPPAFKNHILKKYGYEHEDRVKSWSNIDALWSFYGGKVDHQYTNLQIKPTDIMNTLPTIY
jgi:hypothetical protein